MVSCQDVTFLAAIASSRLRPRLVLSILFSPFYLFVAATTYMDVWRCQNFSSCFAFGIMLVCEFILMLGCVPFFLFLLMWILRHGQRMVAFKTIKGLDQSLPLYSIETNAHETFLPDLVYIDSSIERRV